MTFEGRGCELHPLVRLDPEYKKRSSWLQQGLTSIRSHVQGRQKAQAERQDDPSTPSQFSFGRSMIRLLGPRRGRIGI